MVMRDLLLWLRVRQATDRTRQQCQMVAACGEENVLFTEFIIISYFFRITHFIILK
jgi:hypothetical protein